MDKVYLSGPMSSYPYYNEGMFDVADRLAQELGWQTVNPANKDRESGIVMDPHGTPLPREEYEAVLASDFAELYECSAIWLLPHWEQSEGARREHLYAVGIGLHVYEFGKDELPRIMRAGSHV